MPVFIPAFIIPEANNIKLVEERRLQQVLNYLNSGIFTIFNKKGDKGKKMSRMTLKAA